MRPGQGSAPPTNVNLMVAAAPTDTSAVRPISQPPALSRRAAYDDSPERPPTPQEFHQYGLIYREWGLSPFPVKSDKMPAVPWKPLQTRRPTDRSLGRMFGRECVGGVATVLGGISGGRGAVLACRDFDRTEGYACWAAAWPDVAAVAPTVRTLRGYHVYLRLAGPEVYATFPDGDMAGELRASCRQISILPPSLRGDRIGYRWFRNEPYSLDGFPLMDLAATGFYDSLPRPPAPLKEDKRTRRLLVSSSRLLGRIEPAVGRA